MDIKNPCKTQPVPKWQGGWGGWGGEGKLVVKYYEYPDKRQKDLTTSPFAYAVRSFYL